MSILPRLGVLALALIALAAPASAHEVKIGTLVVTDLWTRATPPGAPAAGGFLTITNTGTETDRLVAASSELGPCSLHETVTENGIASMRPVDGIEIPAGGTVKLAPGGYHIMIEGLTQPLAEGGEAPISLTFEKAGSVDTFLHVEAIGAGSMDMNVDHGDMNMGGDMGGDTGDMGHDQGTGQ
jgi:copper(I)-binding protein